MLLAAGEDLFDLVCFVGLDGGHVELGTFDEEKLLLFAVQRVISAVHEEATRNVATSQEANLEDYRHDVGRCFRIKR